MNADCAAGPDVINADPCRGSGSCRARGPKSVEKDIRIQCWGSVTFWCGSVPLTNGTGTPDPTPFL
jgi:hypothetical protein